MSSNYLFFKCAGCDKVMCRYHWLNHKPCRTGGRAFFDGVCEVCK